MNPIYTVQNNRVALSILNCLDRTRKRGGADQPAPAIRFEIARKTQLAPGHYTINRAAALAHNLSLEKARLLFHDIANGHFDQDYQVIFRDHPGSISDQASMLSATYRIYDEQHAARIILEVWDGPGKLDAKMGWVYPLNKDEHALAIILDLAEARQMALTVLAQIQVWETVAALRESGLIPPARETRPQQLSLAGVVV
jgi:hypothetical protein